MAGDTVIRGDSALARAIFGDQKKRRLVPILEAEGWAPFVHIAGKRALTEGEIAAARARDHKKAIERNKRAAARTQRQRRKTTATAAHASA